METVRNKMGYDECFVVKAINKAGGMATLWNRKEQIKRVEATTFIMEVLIQDAKTKVEWWCVGIYASTNSIIKSEQ